MKKVNFDSDGNVCVGGSIKQWHLDDDSSGKDDTVILVIVLMLSDDYDGSDV